MRFARFLRVMSIYFSLSLLIAGQTASQRPSSSRDSAGNATESQLIYTTTMVEWPVSVPDAGLLLTVSGPGGLYLQQENPAGTWSRFSLVNERGQMRLDGVYKWELVSQGGWEVPDQANQLQSGWFEIRNGKVVAEGTGGKQPVVVEEQAPANTLYVDSQGRVGLGTSVPASQLHLKGILPAVTLEDTTTGGGLFTWRGLQNGDGSLALFDKAGQARWLVDSEGRVGINTTKPTSTLTVDGYVEATKGFLVNGKPVGMGFGLIGGSQPLSTETANNNFFGTGAGAAGPTGNYDAFFGAEAGYSDTTGAENSFFGTFAGRSTTTGGLNSFFGKSAGYFNTAGVRNSYFGAGAGKDSTGSDNSFFGTFAGYNNQAASGNSFFGEAAGYNTTAGDSNSFFGYHSGYFNVTGWSNSFFGYSAGRDNTTGNYNSFFGYSAGRDNTTGMLNSFFGSNAGAVNTTGVYNVFVGNNAGSSNTDGSFNCFFGVGAGHFNTTSTHNSFFGDASGQSNITGSNNSFFGSGSGMGNTTGLSNSSFGFGAGSSNTVGNYNTFVGAWADLVPGTPGTVTNATAIGARAYVAQSNSLVLGSIAGVNGGSSVNVGIGTSSPDRQLVVEGSQAIGKFRRFSETGPDFGPAFLFERARGTNIAPLDIVAGDYLGKVQFRGRVGGNMPEYGALTFIASDTNQNGRFSFVDRDMVTERVVILNTGNVGIGTNAPTERLDVNGNLRVRGGIVYGAPAVAVPDYVFEPGYQLVSLPELQKYVRAEKHLPHVPNASEIRANGVNLGELQMTLLEKIEELTLYAVQQEEAHNRLKAEAAAHAAALNDRIQALEQIVKTLMERDSVRR